MIKEEEGGILPKKFVGVIAELMKGIKGNCCLLTGLFRIESRWDFLALKLEVDW